MKTRTLLILLLLCICSLGYAQSGRFFTADKELSNSLVNKIYQDRKGIVWIATEDGLNRYDGAKFTIYRHDKDDKNSLLNDYVHALFEDSKENLYIGFFKGLQRYDYATNSFIEIPIVLKEGNTKFNAHVVCILERRNGEILIGCGGLGLFRLEHDPKEGLLAKELSTAYKCDQIASLFEDNQNRLWVTTENNGAFCETGKNTYKNYLKDETEKRNDVQSICQDKEGNIYAGSLNRGFFRYHPQSDSFRPILSADGKQLTVKTLYLNQRGNIYIGTDGNGMKTFYPKENKLIDSNSALATFDFSKTKVHSILEDQAGNTWLGIFQKGVLLLPNDLSKFNYIGYKSVNNNIIGSSCIMAVYEDHEQTLWIGTDNDGIYAIDSSGKLKAHFSPNGTPSSVPATIMTIYEDSQNTLWIGSYRDGVAKMNPTNGHCEYVHLKDENNNHISRIYHITEDNQQNIWICSMGSGLCCIEKGGKRVTHYHTQSPYSPEKNTLNNDWINSLLATPEGKLYIASYYGIGCMDIATRNFTSTYGKSNLLEKQIIYTFYQDKQGNIWAGTSNGLSKIDHQTQEITTYTKKDGLPSNMVCAIQGDDDGYLWISTNHGISRFNPRDKEFINYFSSDGLQGNEFSRNASIRSRDGKLIFGGLNGLVSFYPKEITKPVQDLKIRITDFYIYDEAVHKGSKSGPYEVVSQAVMNENFFHLSHEDNSFSIEFSTMDFNNPERIIYSYSLNNDKWVSLSPGSNRVSFNNLAPGTYHFKVKAQDYNNVSKEKEITILISPAWYASVWAKCIYALLAIVIVYLFVQQVRQRYRARQEMLEHIHGEQINEAKLQFFINISHEIRTPMSLIISPLEKLIRADNDSERQKTYSLIHRNANRILQLINQLMDIRKIDKGQMALKFQEAELIGTLQEICTIFDYQAKNKQIDFQFHHSIDSLPIWIDPKSFDKIIVNILSNAFKFTPDNGKIDLYVNSDVEQESKRQWVEIMVSDSGIGINEQERERIFERFYQIRNSQNNSNIGTGIGLHLTRSLVELHHGTIEAVNNEDGKGCRFIIRLPLGNEHLLVEEIEDKATSPIPLSAAITLPIEESTSETEKEKTKNRRKYKILVVEDDEEIRKYICDELGVNHYMTECTNGKEALTLILQKTPDLVISDVMMPEMDGITLCRKIKQNVNVNHVPVILLTAKSAEEDKLEGLSIGADAYISKPFSLEILKKTVVNIIQNREMLRNTYNGSQDQAENIPEMTLKSSDEKLMEKVMATIHSNITNTQLNGEMIAKEVGISRVHLHRKLKELTNQSTRDLIRNTRLKQAASLLASGKPIDVSEAAYATGFTNMPYFSSAFKELYGIPPKVYMEEHLKKTE